MEVLPKKTGPRELENPMDQKRYFLIKHAARKMGVSLQYMYKAIRGGKIKTTKVPVPKRHPRASGFITVTTMEWLEEWRKTISSREFQLYNGKPIIDKEKDQMTVRQSYELLGWTKNRFMYYLKRGDIKYIMKGSFYILDRKDVLEFKEKMDNLEEARSA